MLLLSIEKRLFEVAGTIVACNLPHSSFLMPGF